MNMRGRQINMRRGAREGDAGLSVGTPHFD